MKTVVLSKVKKVVLTLMVLFAMGISFAQVNDVYTKIGSNIFTKEPIKDSDVVFGGIYNESRAFLNFDQFWVDGKVTGAIYSVDEWNSVNFELLESGTYINAGFSPFSFLEFVVGTNYDRVLPGTYMYAYDAILPNARFGNTGATVIFTGLKPILGITAAANIPFQVGMFSDYNGMEINAALYYESFFGIDLGTRIYGDFNDDFAIAAFLSGNLGSFNWMAGYTHNGTGYNNVIPADHYIDASVQFGLGMFAMGADFEIGFGGINDSRPLYTGIRAEFEPISSMNAQLAVLMSVADTKDYENTTKSLLINPKIAFDMNYSEIGIGAEILICDVPNQDNAVGFAFPVYFKHWF